MMNKKSKKKSVQRGASLGTKAFVLQAIRVVYGVFFLGAGLYFMATQVSLLLQRSSLFNGALLVLALYLSFTGFVLLLPERIRCSFILPYFKKAPLAQLFVWLALPFLWIGLTLFMRGTRSNEVFIAIAFGVVFGLLGFLYRSRKNGKK